MPSIRRNLTDQYPRRAKQQTITAAGCTYGLHLPLDAEVCASGGAGTSKTWLIGRRGELRAIFFGELARTSHGVVHVKSKEPGVQMSSQSFRRADGSQIVYHADTKLHDMTEFGAPAAIPG